ncbi:hypothetical protein [Sedimentitalea nanhaiensis]|uniref:Uncharacterized protein n=1 Tax=Sedimentitalea nanhaiensis TaxID=999627 RepID=A0A1I7E3T7_9RHOB|nr:hypothetical protein [Sedimentitalea nanhaiensis]SFU18600.1 hypothetical protein SAMN05216236_14318 [Sedimentitalea nanhaiensis]
MSAKPKDAFERMASNEAHVRREGLPDPSLVAGSGIKTKEALDWMALERPDRPELVREIDDECLRREVQDATIEEKRTQVRNMRMRFRQTARKGREDFETARSFRGHEHERE